MTRLLPILALAALLPGVAACSDAPATVDVSNLRLQSEGQQYPMLTGWLVNRGETAVGSADVVVTLYDEQNQPIDDVIMQVRAVAPGDSARFAQKLDLRAAAARLKFVGVN